MTLFFFIHCGGTASDDTNGDDSTSSTPILYNLGISFDDFDFDSLGTRDPLIVFGNVLSGTTLNPTFEYYLDVNATIISPVNGTITSIDEREDSSDYSVVITPTDATDWWVVLDHVLNVAVSVDDVVSAGDSLGTAGTWEGSIGRTELQIVNNNDGLSYCPTNLLDSSVDAETKDDVSTLISDWEEHKGDTTTYDESLMDPIGCLTTTVQG